jgi:aspartate aminotransferase-like enzyme
MNEETLLLTPGPVQVPRAVLEAGAAPMTHHNAPEFQALLKPLLTDLRPFFGNDGPLLIQNSSGRGAMEASLTNLFNPGDAVAVMVNGRFGLRFAAIAKDMGLVVHPVSPEWGRTASESLIVDTLSRHGEIKGLIGCLCETGTGVMNDLEMVGRIGTHFGVITVMDAVSAAAGMHIDMREQNIDVCFSGIQKCFMCPPGLALIAINERVWKTIVDCKHYRHYFNWVKMRDWIEAPKARMMGTPPESLIRSLACAVSMMHAEGLTRVYSRHALLGDAFRAFVHGAGCALAAKEPKHYSNTVSAMELPAAIRAADVVRKVRENDNILIASGQDSLKETAIRVGHMGPVQTEMLERGMHAISRALGQLGMQAKRLENGVEACVRVLRQTTHSQSSFTVNAER